MRRLPILFVLVLMFALLALVPASAVKPNCDEDPTHSACKADDPTPPATTPDCTSDLLTGITGNGRVFVECLWTPTDSGLTEGIVTVEPTRAISSLVVFVRDSAPGDICLLTQPGKVVGQFSASFDLAYGSVDDMVKVALWDPRDYEEYPENERPPSFDPYVGQTYWSFSEYDADGENGTHWCYPKDGVPGMRQDLNGEPLVLNVGWIAKKNTTVSVTLSPVQES
jgi:hypothetical protein